MVMLFEIILLFDNEGPTTEQTASGDVSHVGSYPGLVPPNISMSDLLGTMKPVYLHQHTIAQISYLSPDKLYAQKDYLNMWSNLRTYAPHFCPFATRCRYEDVQLVSLTHTT